MEAITNNKAVSTHTTNNNKQSVTKEYRDINSLSEQHDVKKEIKAMASTIQSEEIKITEQNSTESTTSIFNEVIKESKVSGIKLKSSKFAN